MLLALLSMTAGVGASSAVLCIADDHVAVETALDAGHCDGRASPADAGQSLVSAASCTDVAAAGVDSEPPAPTGAASVPAPPPAVLIAVLSEPRVPAWAVDDRDDAGLPPPHLLPLRSFVLLT